MRCICTSFVSLTSAKAKVADKKGKAATLLSNISLQRLS